MQRALVMIVLAGCRIGFDPVDGEASEDPATEVGVGTMSSAQVIIAEPGSDFYTACTPGAPCAVDCTAASTCIVACNGASSCDVACTESQCIVEECLPQACQVDCGGGMRWAIESNVFCDG